jgi:hypothetical protein
MLQTPEAWPDPLLLLADYPLHLRSNQILLPNMITQRSDWPAMRETAVGNRPVNNATICTRDGAQGNDTRRDKLAAKSKPAQWQILSHNNTWSNHGLE